MSNTLTTVIGGRNDFAADKEINANLVGNTPVTALFISIYSQFLTGVAIRKILGAIFFNAVAKITGIALFTGR